MYASATGATEVQHMQYMSRLGLWATGNREECTAGDTQKPQWVHSRVSPFLTSDWLSQHANLVVDALKGQRASHGHSGNAHGLAQATSRKPSCDAIVQWLPSVRTMHRSQEADLQKKDPQRT
eukprot:4828701-Amphidinium_carterae.1